MDLFEQCARSAAAIARIGEDVRTLAIATNTSISYTEPEFGTDVIREFPDGHRERTTSDGLVVLMPPRKR